MMPCPTFQRVLEIERDEWFGTIKGQSRPLGERGPIILWEQASEALSRMLGRDHLEKFLLPDPNERKDT